MSLQSFLIVLLISVAVFAAPPSHEEEVIEEVIEDPIEEGTSDKRIINGRLADEREFPFMCSFQKKIPSEDKPHKFCGSALIDSCWVVTAAHCFDHIRKKDEPNLQINCGVLNAFDYGRQSQLFPVEKYICHEKYSPISTKNDICLIKLKGKCVCKRNVQLAQLVSKDFKAEGKKAHILGWGYRDPKEEISTEFLYASPVDIGTAEDCKKHDIEIGPKQLCVGPHNLDTTACQGDSGSPLVSEGKVAGVASYGSLKGCNPKEPVVYTNMAEYVDWIDETLTREGRCGAC